MGQHQVLHQLLVVLTLLLAVVGVQILILVLLVVQVLFILGGGCNAIFFSFRC